MAQAEDLSVVLKNGLFEFEKIISNKNEFMNNEKVIKLLIFLHESYYFQIHTYLTGLNNFVGEQMIRSNIRDIAIKILPVCYEKLWRTQRDNELSGKYLKIYDDFYALVSFRSLEHFAQYMEFDKTDEQKLWKPTLHLFKGFWFYANQMVLDGSVKFISKQCFTGLGKTYSNAILLSFIYGYDINADALYVFGASENVGTFTMGLVDLMTSDRYAKVFPYYQKFNGKEKEMTANAMFSIRQVKDTGSKLRISGSSKMNLRVVSKEKNTNGVRAKYLFLDDIAQMIDSGNLKAHQKDIAKLEGEWFERKYDYNNFYIIAGGTTYSSDDILTYLIKKNNIEDAKPAIIGGKVNKFTKIGETNYIVKGKSCFICIPMLDYDTDESTYPEKYPTESAKRKRDESTDGGRLFEAMSQQRPIPSDANPYDYGNIKTYTELPPSEFEGGTRRSRSRASIDPSRKGKDNCCMLVYSEDKDKNYLIDAFIDRKPLDYKYEDGSDVIDKFCELVIRHNIYDMVVEENTASNIVTQIKDRLATKYNYHDIKIRGTYSTKVKKDKIFNAQATILSTIIFPARRLFAPNSMMGKSMRQITYWQYESNIEDDAPDTLAVFVLEYIKDVRLNYQRIGTFRR